MSKVEITTEMEEIVVNGIEESMSDDDILMKLFQEGVPFNQLRKVFNEVVQGKELRLSSAQRKAKTADLLEGWEPEGSEDVLEKVGRLGRYLPLVVGHFHQQRHPGGQSF